MRHLTLYATLLSAVFLLTACSTDYYDEEAYEEALRHQQRENIFIRRHIGQDTDLLHRYGQFFFICLQNAEIDIFGVTQQRINRILLPESHLKAVDAAVFLQRNTGERLSR